MRPEYLPGHEVRLVHSGVEYFDELTDMIRSAVNSIHLQFYILDDDATGNRIITELKDAVVRGVRAYLMVDSFGSYSLNREFRKKLKEAGIFFRFFSPLPFPGITQAGRRLHHKICVADSKQALVGGINIADKYSGESPAPWLDYAVWVKGPVCLEIESLCLRIWRRKFTRYPYERKDPLFKEKKGVLVRLSQNDWFRSKNEISAAYKKMLDNARESIYIVASYFTPSRRLLKILVRSAGRGRDIRIILTQQSDVFMMKSAMSYLFGRLLQSGIRIFEYTGSILHAKACVVDKEWVSIGSHNLNQLSEFMSVETNVDILDKKFATGFSLELEELMNTRCKELTYADYQKTLKWQTRAYNWLSYKVISLSQRLLYILNRKEAKKPSRKFIKRFNRTNG